MRTVTKKILPVLLSLTLFVSVMPASVMTAYAANAKDAKTLTSAVSAGGTVKLTKDITLTQELVVPSGIEVTLDLNGKTLDRGLDTPQENGSVIRIESGATLTLSDGTGYNAGTVTGGASQNGGGIFNEGTLVIEGGTVKGNKASDNGGGIYNGGTLTLSGGAVEDNEADNGGGVYNGSDAVMTVKERIVVKKAGIDSITYVYNAKITGNRASNLGHGIYNDSEMNLSDAPEIISNGDNDIFNTRGKVITIAGELRNKQKISVKSSGTNPVITENYSLYNTKKPTVFFKSSDPNAVVRMTSAENGEVMLKNDTVSTIVEVYEKQKLVKREEYNNPSDAWKKAMTYTKDCEPFWGFLKDDCVVEITLGTDWNEDICREIGTYKNVVIDLNGHCIRRSGKKQKDGSVFKALKYAKLTINDSNPGASGYKNHKGGVIADGNGDDCGGGIILEDNAWLNMNGGTIYNCITDEHGGGIYAKGNNVNITIKDCTVDSCKTKDSGDDCHGGGIYSKNTYNLSLTDVTIKNCESEDKGGALYMREKPGYVNLSNVTFESNFANDGGGAIFIEDLSSSKEFEFVAENCTFVKNKANDRGGAVYVDDDDESEYRNPTSFRDCVFKENESTKNGSAIEVNDNGVVLSGGLITGNKTSEKGAVYVEDEYDITVAGKLIIKDNKGKSGNQNLVLEKDDTKAYVYSAGLYEGSEIYVSNSGGATGIVGGKDMSKYQMQYFHPEKGTLTFKKTGTKQAKLVTTASLFGEGSRSIIITLLTVAALVCAAALVIKKKKGADEDDDEDEE